MGGNLSFNVGADSIATPGKKSIICEGLDSVDADKFFATCEEYIREGKTANGKEASFEVIAKDGGHLVTHKYEVPAMFGGGSFTVRHQYNFDAATRTVTQKTYLSDLLFQEGTPSSIAMLVVHTGPVKLEYWVDAQKVRLSGRMLKGMLDHAFKEHDITAKVAEDQPCVAGDGKRSVVSEAIADGEATPDNFMEKFKTMLVDKNGATELPDGTVIEDRSGFLEVLNGFKSFAKHTFSMDEGRVEMFEYGEDESLSMLRSVTTMQVHKSPFRVEIWGDTAEDRFASETELRVFKPFVEKVLEFMQGKA